MRALTESEAKAFHDRLNAIQRRKEEKKEQRQQEVEKRRHDVEAARQEAELLKKDEHFEGVPTPKPKSIAEEYGMDEYDTR